VLLNDVSP